MERKTVVKGIFTFFLCCVVLMNLQSCAESFYSESSENGGEISYVLNKRTKKIHRSDCGTGAQILEKNRAIYQGDIGILLERGYTTCGNCFQ